MRGRSPKQSPSVNAEIASSAALPRNDVKGRKLRYPWGDEFDAGKGNTEESGVGTTTPVGQYSPAGDSPAGCADMAGNVWEWTSSEFEAYPGSDYQDEYYGKGWKVLRGGSYYRDKRYVRAAFRLNNWNLRDGDSGFRAALAASSSAL